ncbi:hypothetical protein ACFQ7F_33630 [Streptomyces sp. NPDC056486]|uniref:hypothetical protein n=1 Tax=Streptomyces sp. NPDC056486 TaxID=3345835 RepID=UPI0036BF8C4C
MGVPALGLIERVRIGEHAVTLAFPSLQDDGSLRASSDYRGKPLPEQIAQVAEGRRWGYRSIDHLYYVSYASASLLLDPQEAKPDSPEFGALSKAYFGWFRIVQEWASAWSGQPLGNFDVSHESALHLPARGGYLSASPVQTRTIFIGARPLSRAELIGALRHASRGEQLPVEHRLLLSAHDAQSGGDLRKAVIDAATATEVALGSYVADHLRGRGLKSDFIEEVIEDVNGIANLHKLCTHLGGDPKVSQKRLGQELANVRNRAAHRGALPTPEEATTARGHAQTIVRALRPIPEA